MIGHQAISASAGSGKTFQLAHRYILLLAHDVPPDRIAAMTFSRKAAGEIFDFIVKYLCEAALTPANASRLGERIGMPDITQARALQMLRLLLRSLQRLHIGTLDSFIVGVLRAFPLELGIPAEFTMADSEGPAAVLLRQQVLSRIFDRRALDAAARQRFLEAFKLATFGQEEKGLERSLGGFLDRHREAYQALPREEAWGDPHRIWPSGSPWLRPAAEDAAAVLERLQAAIGRRTLDARLAERWRAFFEQWPAYSPGAPWPAAFAYLVERVLPLAQDLRDGKAQLSLERKKIDFTAAECALVLVLLTHVVGAELRNATLRTRGIFRVLEQYEAAYDAMARRRGQFTFSDAQYLLSGGAQRRSLLSRDTADDGRLHIDYRLDCRLDHWLLDEFQDTSDLQWEVLANLVDEVVQDNSGRRSFFYVGDVKQAIYAWRGGDAQLFGRVLRHYGERIEQRPLSTSFRSCPPVIETVNGVFDALPDEIPAAVREQWQSVWQKHTSAIPGTGYAAILEPPCPAGRPKPDDEDRYRIAAALLRTIEPLRRGLSVAVLVRTNDTGHEIVNYLRAECPGMDVIHEGRAVLEDNPVVSVLLSLVAFAAHPGDQFAWRHLQMSPLRTALARHAAGGEELPLALLREISAGGFQAFVRDWGARLDAAHPLDAFGHKRLADLGRAAGEFDAGGSRSCAAFLGFVAGYSQREAAMESAVRVMTVHQAKGLGFDIVILPDLQDGNLVAQGDLDLVTARDAQTSMPQWVLRMPRKIVAESDPVLAAVRREALEKEAFEDLCVVYVAMTRAKRGLYMITSFPGPSSRALTPAALVKMQLTEEPKSRQDADITLDGVPAVCLHATGTADWYREKPLAETPAPCAAAPQEDLAARKSVRRRLARVEPSQLQSAIRSAAWLFAPANRRTLDFGSALHALFEGLIWSDECSAEALVRSWDQASTGDAEQKRAVADQFRRALATPAFQDALRRPAGDVTLWREQHFDVVLEDEWVTGTFDRVVIQRDAKGKPKGAVIQDFKSDAIADDDALAVAVKRHAPQLRLYRRALARILNLDARRIELQLLFTSTGAVRDI